LVAMDLNALMDPMMEGMPEMGMMPEEEQQPPIDPQFTPEALGKFKNDLERDLGAAESSKVQVDERIRRYRAYFSLDKQPPAYEGAPNHVVPYIRAKVMGATAHFRGALDQDPFFVVRPYTSEAARNQPVWETLMERELDRSATQRQLFMAIQESCLTGTGVLQLGVAKPFDEFLIQGKAVRLEDFHVAPAGVEDISRVSTFYRFVEPWHVIRARVEGGEYDPEAAERMKSSLVVRPTSDEKADGTSTNYQKDNQPHEMWECYYRWGDEEHGIPHSLWRVVYTKGHNELLRLEESPFLDCFDAPPYVPLRPLPRIGYFYGESYAQVLEGIQNIMDFAYNSKIAHDQLAIAPPVFVDENSEIWSLISEKGLAPGMIVPTRGDPKASVYALTVAPSNEALSLIDSARTLGEDATFSDLQLNGLPINTVRSATEVNAVTNAASKKLGEDLSNLAYDLSIFAKMFWSLIYKYKVEPAGVMPVFQGSDQYLIAAHEIDQEQITKRMVEYIQQSSGVMFGPEEQGIIEQMVMQKQAGGEQIFISSARRDDLEWVPNGGKLVADKVMRAQKMQTLVQNMMPSLVYAHQFKPFWHAMRDWLVSMDIHNWTDYLPAQSPETMPSASDMAQFSGMMNEMRTGGEQ
jgi:hypothetical protein